MKRKNIIFPLICFLAITSLSSCAFDTLESILNDKYNEFIGGSDNIISNTPSTNVGNSIELLNNAFNSEVDSYGNNLKQDFSSVTYKDSFDNASRLSIDKNTLDLDYCNYLTPSTGKVNGLVIPVEFPDAVAKKVTSNDILPTYQSVSSYYYNTSYGKLEMSFDVLDWQMMSKKSTYYERISDDYYGDAPGASAIIHEVLNKVEDEVDLTKYDNDNDGVIDSLYIIYSAPIDSYSDLWWAFQYTVYETNKYDGLEVGYYVFAGYDFLFEEEQTCNTLTYIHETGHMFGLEDYYDYDDTEGFSKGGLGGADMMDYNIGDHNPFSKLSTGWVNNPILVNLKDEEETTITIDAFSTNGDCIMICDEYDENKGIFQDYFLLSLIDCEDELNINQYPYTVDGVRLYRIHGELDSFYEEGEQFTYYKYDNSYTRYNLIDAINNNKIKQLYANYEYMELCAKNSDLFVAGDSISNLNYYDSLLSKSNYGFEVINIENNKATIRIFRK